MTYALPALITLAALAVYVATGLYVARARGEFKILAPAVTGNPAFERVYRVQMNTLEQLVAFLPALWLCAVFLRPSWAAAIGAVWVAGRILYAAAYYRDAAKRAPGFVLSFVAFALLWLGALWGVIAALLA
jgi:glutathione S-transferase